MERSLRGQLAVTLPEQHDLEGGLPELPALAARTNAPDDCEYAAGLAMLDQLRKGLVQLDVLVLAVVVACAPQFCCNLNWCDGVPMDGGAN